MLRVAHAGGFGPVEEALLLRYERGEALHFSREPVPVRRYEIQYGHHRVGLDSDAALAQPALAIGVHLPRLVGHRITISAARISAAGTAISTISHVVWRSRS